MGGKKGDKDGTELKMEHAMVMQGPDFFNDNNDVNGIDMGITSHDNDGVDSLDMGITVKDNSAKDNDGVDTLDMGITMNNDNYAPIGKKSGGFDKVIAAPNKQYKDTTSSNDPFGVGITLKKKKKKFQPKWDFSHAATKIKKQKDNLFKHRDEDKTVIADIGDISFTEPVAPIEENQEVTNISNELDETGMVDNNNVILGSESSVNGDEDIAVDYQVEDEDQENNYADTENVNVEEINDSQNDINTLETAVLDGDTKVGEVSLEGVGDRFGGAEDRFGGVSNLIEDAVPEEYDTEPIAPIEENQEVTTISNEIDETDTVDNNNVILDYESPMNGDEDIAVDYQEEDEDQENNYADAENVNVEEMNDSQNDINTLESPVLAQDTKVGEVSLEGVGDRFGRTDGFKERIVS